MTPEQIDSIMRWRREMEGWFSCEAPIEQAAFVRRMCGPVGYDLAYYTRRMDRA